MNAIIQGHGAASRAAISGKSVGTGCRLLSWSANTACSKLACGAGATGFSHCYCFTGGNRDRVSTAILNHVFAAFCV